MGKKLSPEVLRQAHSAMERIAEIDRTIQSIGKRAEDNVQEYGKKFRNVIGNMLLTQFRNNKLGQVVICAIINALLHERTAIAVQYTDIIHVPEPPCPPQDPYAGDD